MKRVKLIHKLEKDFIISAYPDEDMIKNHHSLVDWFNIYEYCNVYVEEDPYQTNPQGYIFYSEYYQDGKKFYKAHPVAVYDYELREFFKVYD